MEIGLKRILDYQPKTDSMFFFYYLTIKKCERLIGLSTERINLYNFNILCFRKRKLIIPNNLHL